MAARKGDVKTAFGIAALGILLLFQLTACDPLQGNDSSPPTSVPANAQKVSVQWVVDGDTIDVNAIDQGPVVAGDRRVRVRLLEIDAPESVKPNSPVECYGPEASDALKKLLPRNSAAFVVADRRLRDDYGRFLLYVWNSDGIFVNRRLVEQGYAEAILIRPNARYITTMRAAEKEAKKARRGLWGACK